MLALQLDYVSISSASFSIHQSPSSYLLRELRHVNGFDLPQGGEPLESLLGLLLDCDDKGILHVAVLRQLLRYR